MTATLLRAYPSQIERTGPRQLTGRLVPYNEPTFVMDEKPDGQPDIYQEGFRPGAFSPQSSTDDQAVLRRIKLIHCHEGGLGFLGRSRRCARNPTACTATPWSSAAGLTTSKT